MPSLTHIPPQMLIGNSLPQRELLPALKAGLSPSVCIRPGVGVGGRVTVFIPVLSAFLKGLAKFFCKGSDGKYFSLSRPELFDSLCPILFFVFIFTTL